MLYTLLLEPWGCHRGDEAAGEAVSGWFVQTSKAVAHEKQAVDQNINEHNPYLRRCFPTQLLGE